MADAILTLNAGSSSIKFALFERKDPVPRTPELVGQIDGIGARPRLKAKDRGGRPIDEVGLSLEREQAHHSALAFLVDWLHGHASGPRIAAVGHRVVHGSTRYSRPVRVDVEVLGALRSFIPLAPLHQPHNVAGEKADGKVIVAHLGNGASLCAMEGRRSQATSMGFTAVDGLMMGTRTGNLDPGVLLYLMDHHRMDARALERMLYKESGLLGVSGISQDMRELLASREREAREAVDLFCYRLVREIGALAAVLGGMDALVFTGGIGEHAAPVRERACRALRWLGLEFNAEANAVDATVISRPDSRVTALVLPTNEEWVLARHTAAFLDETAAAPAAPARMQAVAGERR